MSKWTPKNYKIEHNTLVIICWHSKNSEINKRQWISFCPQRWHVPYQNHHACCEKFSFVRSLYPNLPQMGQNLYHGMLRPLHDSMPSFMNLRRVLDLLEFKNQASQCFAGNQRCPGVSNSFPFLAWDLSIHLRTQISFFNQFICTGACACSSVATRPQMACAAVHQCHPWISNADTHSTNGGFITE